MKTYNTYQEAKAASSDTSLILTTGEKWRGFKSVIGAFCVIDALTHQTEEGESPSISCYAWVICNPEDYEEKQPIETPEWNGEGYPPVGVECEISNCGNPWIRCLVKFIGTELCVVNHEDWEQHYHLSSVKFRPLETPEQKKEREELEAAYDLYKTRFDSNVVVYSFEEFKSQHMSKGWLRVVRKTNYTPSTKDTMKG